MKVCAILKIEELKKEEKSEHEQHKTQKRSSDLP